MRLRRLVSQAFTPRAAERMRTACAQIIGELVDRHIDEGSCDVVADIARPYPVPIICTMLGAPREDWPLFSGWLRAISKAFGMTAAPHAANILAAWQHSTDTWTHWSGRRRSTADDLISELVRAEADGARLTRHEILDLVAVLLLAGVDNTRNQLAAAVEVLTDHPYQWALLAERPEFATQAVEEVMRHWPTSFTAVRVAVEDVNLEGVLFPAGTYVVLNTAAANRDPSAMTTPNASTSPERGARDVDIGRRRPPLPRRASRQGRARGSVGKDGSTNAWHSACRPAAVETYCRHHRSQDAPHRIRCWGVAAENVSRRLPLSRHGSSNDTLGVRRGANGIRTRDPHTARSEQGRSLNRLFSTRNAVSSAWFGARLSSALSSDLWSVQPVRQNTATRNQLVATPVVARRQFHR